jgi:uncharacterized protein
VNAGQGEDSRLPLAFNVMVKPRGAVCNLDCRYCYYLRKEQLYPDGDFRMDDDVLEAFTRQYIGAQQVPEVTFAWQGGEPLVAGLDFFERALQFQRKYSRPGMIIRNVVQTNGVLLDDEWCRFLKKHDFLVGISIDGPHEMHDTYRVDKGGRPTLDWVMEGVEFLHKHNVDFNTLTCVHAANADYPLEVYRFLRDKVETHFMQFIPIVLRDNETGFQEGTALTPHSVTGKQYGSFLKTIFDEWVRRDVGTVFVQIFDVALAAWAGEKPGLCVFDETCGTAMVLEHNGDLYSCDHFVEPRYYLGNILSQDLTELVKSEQQVSFSYAKRDTLPEYCRECSVKFICNGGCPKNRVLSTPDGEPGLNYLCEGYRDLFGHVGPTMQYMVRELQEGRSPANIMYVVAQQDALLHMRFATARRNDPCPCGSGLKFKHCHGR